MYIEVIERQASWPFDRNRVSREYSLLVLLAYTSSFLIHRFIAKDRVEQKNNNVILTEAYTSMTSDQSSDDL